MKGFGAVSAELELRRECDELQARIAQLEAQLAQREWQPVASSNGGAWECQCGNDECLNIGFIGFDGSIVMEDGDTGARVHVCFGDDFALCRRVKGDA